MRKRVSAGSYAQYQSEQNRPVDGRLLIAGSMARPRRTHYTVRGRRSYPGCVFLLIKLQLFLLGLVLNTMAKSYLRVTDDSSYSVAEKTGPP